MKMTTVLIYALLSFRTYVCLAYDEWGQDDTLAEDTDNFVGGQLVLSPQNSNGSVIVLTAQVLPKDGLQNGQRTKKTVNGNDEGSGFSSSTTTPPSVPSSTQTTTATTTTATTTTTTTTSASTSQSGHDQARGSDEIITKTTAPPSVPSPDDKSDKMADISDPTGWTTKDILRK